MKQSKHSSRWKSQFFRLDDGFLACYDKKSLVGTTPNKVKRKRVFLKHQVAPRHLSQIVLSVSRTFMHEYISF